MTYEVQVTSSAQADLESIVDWIAIRSATGAAKWIGSYERMLTLLAKHPLAHSYAPENDHVENKIIRNVHFGTSRGRQFRAVYFIRDDVVVLTHLRGPHQRSLSREELHKI